MSTREPIESPACHMCGAAVAPGDRAGTTRFTIWFRAGAPMVQELARPLLIDSPRCPSCSELARRAEELVDAHPQAIIQIGSRQVAVHRVECVLIALAVIGRPLPEPSVPDADLGAMVRHLAVPGGSARWSQKLLPALAIDPQDCSPGPWEHVSDEVRAAAADGAAEVLAERVARSSPPVALPPPSSAVQDAPGALVRGGCLMCGIGAQALTALDVRMAGGPAAASRREWEAVTWPPEALGGPRSPASLSGHVCRACGEAVDSEGAIGAPALERSLAAALAPEVLNRMQYGSMSLPGLCGWGALVDGARRRGAPEPPPNTVRWGHVGELDDLRDRLLAAV